MLHDVIILVPVFILFFIKITKIIDIDTGREGNFDIDTGDGGGGGGPFMTKNPKKLKNKLKTSLFHICFHRKGTLALTLGMGGIPKTPKRSTTTKTTNNIEKYISLKYI